MCFTLAVDIAKSVGVEPSLPRTGRCWSRSRNNVPGEDSETYYRGSIAIQVMNDLITNFQDRMSDRNHTEIFTLLPSLFSKHSNTFNYRLCFSN